MSDPNSKKDSQDFQGATTADSPSAEVKANSPKPQLKRQDASSKLVEADGSAKSSEPTLKKPTLKKGLGSRSLNNAASPETSADKGKESLQALTPEKKLQSRESSEPLTQPQVEEEKEKEKPKTLAENAMDAAGMAVNATEAGVNAVTGTALNVMNKAGTAVSATGLTKEKEPLVELIKGVGLALNKSKEVYSDLKGAGTGLVNCMIGKTPVDKSPQDKPLTPSPTPSVSKGQSIGKGL